MNVELVDKINDDQEVTDDFKQDILNIIMNDPASESNAQSK